MDLGEISKPFDYGFILYFLINYRMLDHFFIPKLNNYETPDNDKLNFEMLRII